MNFQLVTLFPEMFQALSDWGITGQAWQKNKWQLQCWNPRDFTHDKHRTIDDRPYGGGPGMVLKAAPLAAAVQAAQSALSQQGISAPVYLMSAQGPVLNQSLVLNYSHLPAMIIVCGRYEGVDQRFIDQYVDAELSIGDIVLSGGELAAMVVMDAIIRYLPGVLNPDSLAKDSFSAGLLDHPSYTRPEEYDGLAVPPVLLSGDHRLIAQWRHREALCSTAMKRPDLLDSIADSPKDEQK